MKGIITMTILDRLKLELNKDYFTDEEYKQFLKENGVDTLINPEYNKLTMQKQLLLTVLDVFEVLANDIDIMRRVETEFTTTTDAYKSLEQRIQRVKDRIASIPEVQEDYSPFSLIYTRK